VNGCVVVTEGSLDSDPLVPGEHMLVGAAETLGQLTERLLEDGHARWRMQTAAYDFMHDRLRLGSAVERLAEAARRLDERSVPSPSLAFFEQPPPRPRDAEVALARLLPPQESPGDGALRRVLKDLRLELLELRRRVDRLAAQRDGAEPPAVVLDACSRGWTAARSRISVLLTVYNYEREVVEALDSLLKSRVRSWEVVIVDDGSCDRSVQRVAAWMRRHPLVPAVLLRHPVNRGLGHARNAALDLARGELCFVLDADNAVLPWCFERLLAALDADPEAACAYGMLERFSRSGTVGLSNIYPWEPARFRAGNYIDAMALIRTRVLRALGGYRTDPRLYGWEDFDLWARMAERGLHAVHVPSVVARYRTTDHSMLTITNISGAEATSLIAAASPTVMAGAVVPP
jgi:Glycosyl transferase family 2